jgi:ABC-type multidrug transport system ATPase subunit
MVNGSSDEQIISTSPAWRQDSPMSRNFLARNLSSGNMALGQIVASGLTLVERGRVHVAGLSLTVKAGEIVGLVGKPGSGKSKCLALIGGVIEPTYGVLRLSETPFSVIQPSAVADTDLTTNGSMSTDDWLAQLRDDDGPPGTALRARIHTVLEDIGWGEPISLRNHDPGPGERSILGLALAIASDSSVILIDEPMKDLAAEHAKRAWKMLRNMSDAGKAVLISVDDSDLNSVDCDRFYLIENGTVTRRGTLRDIHGPLPAEENTGDIDDRPRSNGWDSANSRPKTGAN